MFQKLQNTEEEKCSLERQHNQLIADLSKSELQAGSQLNGVPNDSIRENGIKTPLQVGNFKYHKFFLGNFLVTQIKGVYCTLVLHSNVLSQVTLISL